MTDGQGNCAGLALFFVGVPFLLLSLIAGAVHAPTTPANAVLSLDLRKSLSDQDSPNPLSALTGRSLAVTSVAQALHRTESDNRVKALFVRLPEGGISPGRGGRVTAGRSSASAPPASRSSCTARASTRAAR